MTYRRIVVGTDGSDSADRAVVQAAWLCRRLGAELLVSHAYSTPSDPHEGRTVGASILRDACGRLDGPAPKARLREGDAASALVGVAHEEDADLIVVGNRGLGTRRVLVGTVAAKVIGTAPCDVLVAHTSDRRPPEIASVLTGTDGSPTAAQAEAVGMGLAEALGAGHESVQVTGEDPAEGLARLATERGADVVVVGNKGVIGARRFLTSVPSRVARGAPCHVLLVKTT
ncbi:MAG TPA: universal stress protein [Actinomycetota bacterium]|nr:universal stress protein [Actinomycetota bacterium]